MMCLTISKLNYQINVVFSHVFYLLSFNLWFYVILGFLISATTMALMLYIDDSMMYVLEVHFLLL